MHGLLLAFVASLLHGMRHATDADHIVAVSTIVNRERSAWRSSRIGVMWGLGHTLTIFVVGGAIVLFKLAFTPRVGLSMEFSVALMLMVLGYLNLTRRDPVPESVPHFRPFLVGMVHGMAGSAAATLLILPLIDDPRLALLYLGVFGLGTIVGRGNEARPPTTRNSLCIRRCEPCLWRVSRLQGRVRRRAVHRSAPLDAAVMRV